MRKIVIDDYIVGVGNKGNEITEEEHGAIIEAIKSKPIAPAGHIYKLKNTLKWELCEVPESEMSDEDGESVAEEDYLAALKKLGVE